MADYGKLFSRIWSNEDFRKLNGHEQQLYCLLISFPTRNLAGVLPLTVKRWANCTADATEKSIFDAIEALQSLRFVVVDYDTEEVLVRTFIRNDEVYKQPNLMKAALKDVKKTESQALRRTLQSELLAIPEHRDQESTYEVAELLVETHAEEFSKTSRSHLEDIVDDSGVGGGLSNQPAPPTPTPETTPATITPTKRGTRLPDDWSPPTDVISAMHNEFPYVDLRSEHDKFCDYWHAKPGKEALKLDWVKTWRNWIRNAAERTPKNNGRRIATSDRVISEIDALRDNPRLQFAALPRQKELHRGS